MEIVESVSASTIAAETVNKVAAAAAAAVTLAETDAPMPLKRESDEKETGSAIVVLGSAARTAQPRSIPMNQQRNLVG